MKIETKHTLLKYWMIAGQCCLLLSVFAFLDKPISGLPTGSKTGFILVAIYAFTAGSGILCYRHLSKQNSK